MSEPDKHDQEMIERYLGVYLNELNSTLSANARYAAAHLIAAVRAEELARSVKLVAMPYLPPWKEML
jgi:predicted solute-binding protein